MWLRWFPWRYLISRLARSHGFLDPLTLLARLRQFAQPSEVAEPIELLRAGLVLHARGLINSRVIQHNLDWVWPFWVERQFDPLDDAFIPRAFSLTHINLTHRNWTAVGQPDCDCLPIVDPRGLVTPLWDGWSVDGWLIEPGTEPLVPSRAGEAVQRLCIEDGLAVETVTRTVGKTLRSKVDVTLDDRHPSCRIRFEADGPRRAWLALVVRPVNPEGISFIHSIDWDPESRSFSIDADARIRLPKQPDLVCMSDYRHGDVFEHLSWNDSGNAPTVNSVRNHIKCDVGMATAAALYHWDNTGGSASDGQPRRPAFQVEALVPLAKAATAGRISPGHTSENCAGVPSWSEILESTCALQVPDGRTRFLFDAAVRSLVLHAPEEVYPGPYTYRRFWFRDAAFILHSLLMLGLVDRVGRAIERFPDRQTSLGYFRSQEGEWDSNGQVIWIMDRWRRLSGRPLSDRLIRSVASGVHWIERKRLADSGQETHGGLMPAGFSAEHLGPNDYYYWDDFWSWGGLLAGAEILADAGSRAAADQARTSAASLSACIDRSLEQTAANRRQAGVPASPYRRMDSGAVGSLAAGYPLSLWPARDPRLLDTAEFLFRHCRVHGGFFQDMIHSGINPYLTLHLAQVLLRAGDARHVELVDAVARLATSTGQWPEAIHPHTGGGCMGDGQHVWAAAEWVSIIRNWFVREEGQGLVLGSGIPAEWLDRGEPLAFGPTLTPFGPVSVELMGEREEVRVAWQCAGGGVSPPIEVRIPACAPVRASGEAGSVRLRKAGG